MYQHQLLAASTLTRGPACRGKPGMPRPRHLAAPSARQPPLRPLHAHLSRMLGDLQSKWMMLRECRNCRARATSMAISSPCLYHDTRRLCRRQGELSRCVDRCPGDAAGAHATSCRCWNRRLGFTPSRPTKSLELRRAQPRRLPKQEGHSVS